MRILAIFTRNPYAENSGRKSVLRTTVDCLVELGFDIDLAIFDNDRSPVPKSVRAIWLQPIGAARTLLNVIKYGLLGDYSLNECVYFSPRERDHLKALVRQGNHDLVVADMIRTAPLADALCLPTILDLDDLLSERYCQYLASNNELHSAFGYYAARVPRWMLRSMTSLARPILRWESRRLRERELYWARRVQVVSLVSRVEAERLALVAERRVFSLPMALQFPGKVWTSETPRHREAIFVGGMDYQPNIDAVAWYKREVQPHTNVTLHVVGACTAEIRNQLE